MSSAQVIAAKKHSSGPAQSHIDRFLHIQLLKLQLRRRISEPQLLIPRMDLYQDDALPASYAIFELPGVGEGSLRVDVLNDILTIEGKRGPPLRARLNETLRSRARASSPCSIPEFTLADGKYTERELNFGVFRRVVKLPAGTSANTVRHELKDGLLLVTWPRMSNSTVVTGVPAAKVADTRGSI